MYVILTYVFPFFSLCRVHYSSEITRTDVEAELLRGILIFYIENIPNAGRSKLSCIYQI